MLFRDFAGGNAQLRFHQVDAGHRLGDRMLHLDAGVHLDEVELAVLIHEELDRTRVLIADGGEAPLEGLGDVFANSGRHLERGRLFNQLLMTALDGALALSQGDDVAVLVGQDLELDVPGPLNEFLHVQVAIAEGVGRLGVRRLVELGQFLFRANDAHAASAAARRCFEDDRKANRPGPFQRLILILQHAFGAGQDRAPSPSSSPGELFPSHPSAAWPRAWAR